MRPGKLRLLSLALCACVVCVGHPAAGQKAAGQQQASPKDKGAGSAEAQATAQEASPSVKAYRLEYTISELEDGKKINSRNYSLLAQTGELNKIRVGGRVPVATNAGPTTLPSFQYIDIGMNIDCVVQERGGLVLLNTTVDSSGMAPQMEARTQQPVIRQMKSDIRSVLVPGKPTVIGTMDDSTTRGRFQIEVTATKAH